MQACVKAALGPMSRRSVRGKRRFDSTLLERIKFEMWWIKQTTTWFLQCLLAAAAPSESLCNAAVLIFPQIKFVSKFHRMKRRKRSQSVHGLLGQDELELRDASNRWQSDTGRCLWPRPQSSIALHSRQTCTAHLSANVHKLWSLQQKLRTNVLLTQSPKSSLLTSSHLSVQYSSSGWVIKLQNGLVTQFGNCW